MSTQFETSDAHPQAYVRPLRVAMRPDAVFEEARDLVSDLPGWELRGVDEARHILVCGRRKRLLGSDSTVTIRCEGPAGVPSTIVHVRSESAGGFLSHDKANVREFLVPFQRRVC